MDNYLNRVYDDVLQFRLESKGAVLVEGIKWCGKTTTCARAAKSALYLQSPEQRDQYLSIADVAPTALLDGPAPRLIDEWQAAPRLWDAVRAEVDRRGEFGQFILTGSSVPTRIDATAHSGVGRIARMRMRPMALQESGDSTGDVSLKRLFDGAVLPVARAEGGLDELAFLACRGGWPAAVDKRERVALQQAPDFLDATVEVDISRADGVTRNPHHARMLLRSYARHVSSQGTMGSMQADLAGAGVSMGETALASYIEALRMLFVLEELAAWNPNLRSRTAIRTSPTRHVADPSIAAAALGASPAALMSDLETFGLLFESLCVRDLRTYATPLDGEVLHYRDKTGLECDAVVRLRDGRFGLVEVKLGGPNAIEEGAASLRKLASRLDRQKMPEPSFLMVLVGVGEYSYPRPDGVYVVPVRTLGA